MLLLRVLLLFIYSIHYTFHFIPIFRSFLLSPRLQSSSLRQIWKGEKQGGCEATLEGWTTNRLEVLCPLKFSNFGSFVINRLLYFRQTTNKKQHSIGITYQASANLLSKYRHRPLKNPYKLTTNHETATLHSQNNLNKRQKYSRDMILAPLVPTDCLSMSCHMFCELKSLSSPVGSRFLASRR